MLLPKLLDLRKVLSQRDLLPEVHGFKQLDCAQFVNAELFQPLKQVLQLRGWPVFLSQSADTGSHQGYESLSDFKGLCNASVVVQEDSVCLLLSEAGHYSKKDNSGVAVLAQDLVDYSSPARSVSCIELAQLALPALQHCVCLCD
jgi:hypothetical protein